MIQTYLDFWKNYLNFTGKTTRLGYWLPILINTSIGYFFTLGNRGFSLYTVTNNIFHIMNIYGLLGLIWTLIGIVPTWSVGTRRLRDIGFSPYLILLNFLFIHSVGTFLVMFLCLFPSKYKGDENKVGRMTDE